MDSVVHFELPANDVARARKFYTEAFGWVLTEVPGMDYTMIGTTPVDQNQMPTKPGAINGGLAKRGKGVDQTTVVIGVKSITTALDKVGKLGGKAIMPRTAVGDMGFVGYFQDPEGNVVGLWEDAQKK